MYLSYRVLPLGEEGHDKSGRGREKEDVRNDTPMTPCALHLELTVHQQYLCEFNRTCAKVTAVDKQRERERKSVCVCV